MAANLTSSVGPSGAAAALQESVAAARLLLPVNHAEKTQHAMLAAALHAATGPQVLIVCGRACDVLVMQVCALCKSMVLTMRRALPRFSVKVIAVFAGWCDWHRRSQHNAPCGPSVQKSDLDHLWSLTSGTISNIEAITTLVLWAPLAGSERMPCAAGPRRCAAQPPAGQAGHGPGGGARSFGSRPGPHGRGARRAARQPGARRPARRPPGERRSLLDREPLCVSPAARLPNSVFCTSAHVSIDGERCQVLTSWSPASAPVKVHPPRITMC